MGSDVLAQRQTRIAATMAPALVGPAGTLGLQPANLTALGRSGEVGASALQLVVREGKLDRDAVAAVPVPVKVQGKIEAVIHMVSRSFYANHPNHMVHLPI